MRGPCSFRKRDVTRAIQAVIAAGIEGRVEIEPHGKIVIVIGKSAAQNFVVPIAANDNTWRAQNPDATRTGHWQTLKI